MRISRFGYERGGAGTDDATVLLLHVVPHTQSTLRRNFLADPLAEATVKAIPEDPDAAWGTPERHPAGTR